MTYVKLQMKFPNQYGPRLVVIVYTGDDLKLI